VERPGSDRASTEARLLAHERRARSAAERVVERLEHLQALTAALSEAASPAAVARALVEQARVALGARSGTIYVPSADGTAQAVTIRP